MTTYATGEGTRRYAARFASGASASHYREPAGCATPVEPGPVMSSIGIGTYLGVPDAATDTAYSEAVIAAVEGGINVIDSAINYRFQRSERAIGAAIGGLGRRGFGRDEIVVCTKGGFLTPDGEMPADASGYFEREYLKPGILRPEDVAAGCHAMSPRFLANQLDRSRANLNLDCVDIYYLHNPETQLGVVSREEFMQRLGAAFDFLESAVAAGKIRFYGMATWSGFRQPANAPDYLPLAEIEQLARDVAGGTHRFRFVQLPLNLGMTEALTRPNQSVNGALRGPAVTMVEAADALGISLVGSASLLQGKMTAWLPEFVVQALGLRTNAERSIQFVRSSPDVITALVGMSRVEHVRENLRLIGEPAATPEQFSRLFERGEKQ
ncbi:MAG TPA: aldo/keto reductase [Candidatus Acidoferrales bacterium]